jgi:pimeloyl-ACP methyl ester carboxylesterase
MAAVARDWLPGMVAPDCDADVVAGIEAMLLRTDPEIFARQQRALLGRRDRQALLPTITCPVLLATGAEDRWAPPDQHAVMARDIPDARFEIVPHSGHMLPMEAPAAVADLLARFFGAA